MRPRYQRLPIRFDSHFGHAIRSAMRRVELRRARAADANAQQTKLRNLTHGVAAQKWEFL
jgi:hypothetical protein